MNNDDAAIMKHNETARLIHWLYSLQHVQLRLTRHQLLDQRTRHQHHTSGDANAQKQLQMERTSHSQKHRFHLWYRNPLFVAAFVAQDSAVCSTTQNNCDASEQKIEKRWMRFGHGALAHHDHTQQLHLWCVALWGTHWTLPWVEKCQSALVPKMQTVVACACKRGIVMVVNNAAQIVPRRCSDEILRDSSLFFYSRKYKVALWWLWCIF